MTDALYLNREANASYNSTSTFNNLMGCLGEVVETKLKPQLRQSPFIGTGIDESTDRATEKHLAIVVRYICNAGKCMTQFLDCVAVQDGKAATVVDAVDVTMKKFGVKFGSNGASVMASDIRGVNGMLKKRNPFLVFVHCVAHRLNLAGTVVQWHQQDGNTAKRHCGCLQLCTTQPKATHMLYRNRCSAVAERSEVPALVIKR